MSKKIQLFICAATLSGGLSCAGPSTTQSERAQTVDTLVWGLPGAPVTMVAYSSYTDKYCAKFFNESFPILEKKYITAGQLRMVYRHFPITIGNGSPLSVDAALFAECIQAKSGTAAWQKFHVSVQSLGGQVSGPQLLSAVKDSGVDPASCKAGQSIYADKLVRDRTLADRQLVEGIPMFFINNRPVFGVQPVGVFQQEIEAALRSK